MLQAPDRKLFLWIGGLEAFSQLLGFIGASKLPGVVLPLLQQSLLIWQVTLAYLVLNKRLDSVQVRSLSCLAPLAALSVPDVGGPPINIPHMAGLTTCLSDVSSWRVHVPCADSGSAAGGRGGCHRCMALSRRLSVHRGERLNVAIWSCASSAVKASKTGQDKSVTVTLCSPNVVFPAHRQ